MPFIVKPVESQSVDIDNRKTLVLDVEKTQELTREFETSGPLSRGLTYKEAQEYKSQYGSVEVFKEVLSKTNDKNKLALIIQIDNIDEFYDIIWERTVLELMFMSQYYISLISNLSSFEKVVNSGEEFDFWFANNVKYNMLEKIKRFYIRIVKIYAQKTSLNIYETDLEIKTKEIMNEIEATHLMQIKDLLEIKWNESLEKYKKWSEEQDKKRKSIIFD